MWENKISFDVAVWWPGEHSYGGSNSHSDLAGVREEVSALRSLGYDRPGESEIHVRQVVQRRIELDNLSSKNTATATNIEK